MQDFFFFFWSHCQLSFDGCIEVWLMVIIVKEICKLFILVRLGTVNPSITSLPGLPTRVSLISDSLPVYTGQRGLKREWLCMDKISYLWEGVGWGGGDVIEAWSTWKYLYFLHLLSYDLQCAKLLLCEVCERTCSLYAALPYFARQHVQK